LTNGNDSIISLLALRIWPGYQCIDIWGFSGVWVAGSVPKALMGAFSGAGRIKANLCG